MTDRSRKACQDSDFVKCTCVCVAGSKMARPAMFVLTCLLLAHVGQCTISVVDSHDDLGIVDKGFRTDKSDRSEPSVSLMWGIADTTASVGRFFNYAIPHDAFKGQNLVYKVTEAGKDSLPRWLVFSQGKQLLQGLPTSSDIGQHYIEVVATGPKSEIAKDIFSIFVAEDGPAAGTTLRFKEKGPKTVRCKRSEPETAVSIVVDVDIDSMGAEEKLGFLNKLVDHLNLAEDMLKINQVGNKPVSDASALVSGSGDAKTLKTPGSFVSWLVGCGKVEPDHMQVLQQVEADSNSGMMANAIGHPIHVWHVTNSRFQEHKRRKRQAIRATATPAVTPTLPAKGPTDTIRATGTDQDAMTRPVPTFDSPSFGIQPTKTMSVMEKTVIPGEGGTPVVPTKAPEGGIQPSVGMPDGGAMTKTQVLPTKTYVMTDDMVPTKTTPKPTDTEGEATKDPSGDCKALVPDVRKPIENMAYTVGDIIRYKIPQDTFYDCRIGNTRKLTLALFADKTTVIRKGSWVSFDKNKQLIQGLASSNEVGTHKFTLVAINPDTGDTPAQTPFSITIKHDMDTANRNHELSMTMDYDFDEFSRDTDKQIMFMNKVARIYGDKVKNVAITRIAKGSTVVAWTNKTLSSPDCPVEAIKAMVDKLANEDGTPTAKAAKVMHPFIIKKAGVVPLGACENDPNFPVVATTGDDTDSPSTSDEDDDTPGKDEPSSSPEPGTTTEGVKTGGVGGSSDDIWITTVVPAVVIVAILLLALLIACILYRKKRKGKMNLEDQNTFVNKGVPVIFQDELEDKPTDSSKPLLLEGQPPCPPPEYQRGDSQGSTPPVNHKQPQFDLDGDHIEDTNVNSPLYQPPPPVTASGGNNKPRPHVAQPAYRTQPPSIPP